jgi:hypothetical protein
MADDGRRMQRSTRSFRRGLFQQEGIQIPYPKRDLYVRASPVSNDLRGAPQFNAPIHPTLGNQASGSDD